MFFLFLLSVTLIGASSLIFSCLFKSERITNTAIFFVLTVCAQVILGFETLSLFKSIYAGSFLFFNLLFFAVSMIFYKVYNLKELSLKTNNTNLYKKCAVSIKKKLFDLKTLKGDKILFYMSFFFLFSLAASLFLALYAPVNLWDSTTYHTARIGFWIQNHSLHHYETSSVRQVMFPQNAEILSLWSMVFLKKDYLAGIVQYGSFLGSLLVLFSYLLYLKVSAKRILWAVLIFASLPAVIVQSSSTQNDLVLGFFMFASLYLFIFSVREKEKVSFRFSALSLALALGVKGSVFMYLPSFLIIYLLISIRERRNEIYRLFFSYLGWFLLFFFLLSSYNYILNFLEFGNPLGLNSYMDYFMPPDKNIKSFIANMIRYLLLLVDFSGIEQANIFALPYLVLKVGLFFIFGLSESQGVLYEDIVLLNTRINENFAGFGILGFAILLPLIVRYFYGFIAENLTGKSQNPTKYYISITSIVPVAFLLYISYSFMFTSFNMRYFLTAAIICSPLFALSYTPKNGFFKVFVFAVAVFYFIKTPLYNSLRPIVPVNGLSLIYSKREDVRYNVYSPYDHIFRHAPEYLSFRAKENARIGLIISDQYWYYQFFNQNPNWKIFPLRYEFLTPEKLKNLNYIVIFGDSQRVYSLNPTNQKDLVITSKIDFNLFKNNGFRLVYEIQTKIGGDSPVIFYVFEK